jgi:hypothetical protein
VAQRDLKRVRRRAEQLENARIALRDAIVIAIDSGESVRDVAPFAGLSPSRIHQLLREAREAERQRDEEP